MKIVSWNVNGIRSCAQKGFSDFVKNLDPDILCVQETKAHPEQVDEELRQFHDFKGFWSSAEKKGYSGVATFSRWPTGIVQHGMGQLDYDREGRFVISEHPQFNLYNIYFPNGGMNEERHRFKQAFLSDLREHLRSALQQGKEIIVVGDYNIAHREMDIYDPVRLSSASGFLPEERAWFDSFLDLGFVDTFRYFYPEAKHRYSWWSYREFARRGNRGWRIDYICTTQGLVPYFKSAAILDEQMGSDHCPVLLELDFKSAGDSL